MSPGDQSVSASVQGALTQVLRTAGTVTAGALADYIPELALTDPSLFGIAATNVLGSTYGVGDADARFTMQSICKPFVYALALTDRGEDVVHEHVGFEPSGEPFNAISLDERGRPANPMINAGAIVTTSLVEPSDAVARFARILQTLSGFAGRELAMNEAVYASEAMTGDRNRALAFLTKSSGALVGDPAAAADVYFRACAVEATARDLATMGATLANDGLNPLTGVQVIAPRFARDVLSLMASCGMYDGAGEWMFRVGMPAKSGVGGGIIAVKPGQFGVGVFSPLLDAAGNSTRGVAALTELSNAFGLHLLEHPQVLPLPVEPTGHASSVDTVSDGETVHG